MSATGAVNFDYTPEPGDKSTKIVFIQVMRERLDGKPCKPSTILPEYSYQDADTTNGFHHVDYKQGEKDPYYNGDDQAYDVGVQGNAMARPPVTAHSWDAPGLGDDDLPAGATTVNYDFRTAAFSAAGEDAGTYYGYADWAFEKQRGIASTTKVIGNRTGGPGGNFIAAVRLFNRNRGFAMPGEGGRLLGGIIGGVLGGLAGGLLGFGLGGVGGAVLGGVLGAAGVGLAFGFG